MENDKKYNKQDVDKILSKAMYKMMEKAIAKGKKTVIEDVLDDNYEAEVDPDKVPTSKPDILWKKQQNKKGINKLKSFVKGRKK